MRRNILPLLGLLVFLGAFGGFAYFSRYPESPWLAKAEAWPWVGEWAGQFRQAYQPPSEELTWKPTEVEVIALKPPAGQSSTGSVVSDIRLVEPGAAVDMGRSSDARSEPLESETLPLPRPILEHRWFLPGHPLFGTEGSGSDPKIRLSSMAQLPVLTYEKPWAEVLLATEPLWLDTRWQPIAPEKRAAGVSSRRRSLHGKHIQKRLSQARKLLSVDGPVTKIGSHEVYSDVDDQRVFAQLRAMAEIGPQAYVARYGLSPSGPPDWGIVMFSNEADYRAFAAQSNIPMAQARGHSEGGFIALFLEGLSRAEFLVTVAHEQTHVLNDSALSAQLPAWLEEGLATDLGFIWIEDLAAQLTELQGQGESKENVDWEARLASLQRDLKRQDLPSLEGLMHSDRETFYQSAEWAYPYSGAFIRFLLDAENGRYSDKFRAFLKNVGDGGSTEPSALIERLEINSKTLDLAFRHWLANEALLGKERLQKRQTQFYRDQWAIEQHQLRQKASARNDS